MTVDRLISEVWTVIGALERTHHVALNDETRGWYADRLRAAVEAIPHAAAHVSAEDDARQLAKAFKFLSRRCEEQGFYSPNRQPLVLDAHVIADRYADAAAKG